MPTNILSQKKSKFLGFRGGQCTMGICAASFEKFKVEARSEVSASKLRQN